ncbi:YqaJ viral recombinase family protein [Streptomyces sp. NA04227]|uniref:YqaJ viral recombinase family nuclease n=1 Tax=Streptomyces sp. NA04227 TaxID=2742136 RepID=UPI0015917A6D|nr:YqaJ viral recombinase family protein [Streptomyces sp. NA04227]QKW07010.1 YqaJ viral recombinase family protein [Streptomyces sp. NA04227]
MTTIIEPAARVEAPTARLLLPADASREEWEATRRAGIGGSDVAAILGLGGGKYTSPRHVFEAKHGRPDEVSSEAAEIGTEIEGFIARMFTKRSGIPVVMPPGTLVNVNRSWMLANVDRYALDETGQVSGPLECKNRSAYQIDDWEDGKIPDAPAIQCHWYMAVGGWSHGYVAALVGGNTIRWSRLERDEEMIGYLVDYCGSWYQRHVVEGFEPPADGYEATTNLLAKLWSVKAQTIAEIDVVKAKELRARRADLKEQEKALAADLRLVENEMRLLTGENEVAQAGGKAAWSWKANGTFASKKFREAHPELAAKYTHMVEAIDTEGLKVDHPEIYDEHRARVLRVPAKGV